MRFAFIFALLLTTSYSALASQELLLNAVQRSDIQEVRSLVEQGANPFKYSEAGHSAVSIGLVEEEDSEIRAWAQNLSDQSYREAKRVLDYIEHNLLTMEEFQSQLADPTFNIDVKLDSRFGTLVGHLCLLDGKEAFIDALLEHHADPEGKNRESGLLPLDIAIRRGNVGAIETLISHGANIHSWDDSGRTALHQLASGRFAGSRDRHIARFLIKAGADIDARGSDEQTPLMQAVKHDRADLVREFISAGADVNLSDSSGDTALFHAVFRQSVESIEIIGLLVEGGAELNLKNSSRRTALHQVGSEFGVFATRDPDEKIAWASQASQRDVAIASLLIASGAAINEPGTIGETPLLYALIQERNDVAKVLLREGADPDHADNRGWTPLSVAIYYKDDEMLDLLIKAGADLQGTGKDGMGHLAWAIKHGSYDMPKKLLEAGLSPNSQSYPRYSPIMAAVEESRRRLLRELIIAGFDPNAVSHEGWTALHLAAGARGFAPVFENDMTEALLDGGADPNIVGPDGLTPLMVAAKNGELGIAKLLLKAGAKTDLTNMDGKAAEDLARQGQMKSLMRAIQMAK